MWSVGKFIATRSPPSIRADPERAGVSKHLLRGRRWRVRRGLFPPDLFPGSGWWQVRGPHEPSRRRVLRTRSECRELESFLERPEAHAVRQRDVFARKKPCQDRASRDRGRGASSSHSRERRGDFCLPAPRSSLRPFDRTGRDRRRGFAGLGESVVENLTFAGALRIDEETMAVLGGGAKAHGEEEELSLGSEDRQWPGQRPMHSVDSWFPPYAS